MRTFHNNLISRKTTKDDNSQRERLSLLKKAGRGVATTLISGLMLLGCNSCESSTAKHWPDLNKAPVSLMARDKNCSLSIEENKSSGLAFDNFPEEGRGEVNVKRGDTLWRVDSTGKTEDNDHAKSHVSYNIADVDEDGVLLRIESINPCEVSCMYFRVNFEGKATPTQPWPSGNTLKAERTDNPDVAKLSAGLDAPPRRP